MIFLGFNDFILFYFLQQTHREEPLHQVERQQGHKHTPDLYVLSYFQQKLCFYGCFFFGFCSILPTLNAEVCCGTFFCLFFFFFLHTAADACVSAAPVASPAASPRSSPCEARFGVHQVRSGNGHVPSSMGRAGRT